MQRKKWVYKNKSINKEQLNKLTQKLSPIVATLLLNRGIFEPEEVADYFKKQLSGVFSPFLLEGMKEACERIVLALKNNEKIMIYGDYDVDGITSTVLLYKFLRSQGADVSYYIPTRFDEGYGINMLALNKIAKGGTKLLITVDCGITAVGEVEFAKLQGMDVLITDHHTCQDKIPKALAVINPKIPGSEYPFPYLAGVGVAFKLALGVSVNLGLDTKEIFDEYSELAAIGTVADLVPLKSENRIIVDRGLKKLYSNSSYPGLRALLEISGATKYDLNASTVAFSVAPRLNAAGRLSSAKESVELLLCDNKNDALVHAKVLDEENKERQLEEQQIFEEALSMIENDAEFDKKKVIVLYKENWHQGVVGIVASRLCDRFFRPTVLISVSDGNGKGSGRSIPGFNLFDALENSSEHLISFGGHSVAAGLNIKPEDIDAFSHHINKYAASRLSDDDLVPTVNIDCEIQPSLINIKNIQFLSNLEPYGVDNETPVFSMCNTEVTSVLKIGINKNHLKLTVVKDNLVFNCIGFGLGEYADILNTGDKIDIAFCMSINNYQNKEIIQLRLKDIHMS